MTCEEKTAVAEQFTDMRTATIRHFETGATRSPQGDKLCYDGFFSPLVMKRVAQYMHKHRTQSDGAIRAPDNWQKGIPQASYMESMWRHFEDIWLYQRGYPDLMEEDIETALCAMQFNSAGMLLEILKEKRKQAGPFQDKEL